MNAEGRVAAAARRLPELFAAALVLLAVAFALDLDGYFGLAFYDQQYFALALGLGYAAAFLAGREIEGGVRVGPVDVACGVVALVAGLLVAVRYPVLVDAQFFRPWDGVGAGVVTVLLTLELVRRTVGWTLVVVVALFLLYALFADRMPEALAGRASDVGRLAVYLAVDVNGILGLPLRIAATVVITFVLFGRLLLHMGGSAFFTDLATALMGRFRGGSAKIAVTASAFFGSISGSAVANVVSTGVVTIPLMRRDGFAPHKAAAMEAAASTGGQLMPPVMGASAFLMAEFLEVPYAQVAVAALVPALLYYLALFLQADLEAARAGIPPVPPQARPRLSATLARGWFFPLSFLVLVLALFVWNRRPETAVLWAVAVLLVSAVVFGAVPARRLPALLWTVLTGTGRAVVDVLAIGAAAGIVIGVLALSGAGFLLTLHLVTIGEGNFGLLLAVTALTSIVLGMGLPTLGVYVLLATLVAPSLVRLGVEPMAAHLYVLYFGLMSMITPPVAIAAYTAASLAEAPPVRTALQAVRFAWPAFVVPVVFVFDPALIGHGTPAAILRAACAAAAGTAFVCIAAGGHLHGPLPLPARLALFVAGLAALFPAPLVPAGVLVQLAGIATGCLALLPCVGGRRRLPAVRNRT